MHGVSVSVSARVSVSVRVRVRAWLPFAGKQRVPLTFKHQLPLTVAPWDPFAGKLAHAPGAKHYALRLESRDARRDGAATFYILDPTDAKGRLDRRKYGIAAYVNEHAEAARGFYLYARDWWAAYEADVPQRAHVKLFARDEAGEKASKRQRLKDDEKQAFGTYASSSADTFTYREKKKSAYGA